MRRQRSTETGARFRGAMDRGAGLAEFAVVLPLLLMILFGIVELGLAFSRSQTVEAAAREGGRLASLSSSSAADVTDRVDLTLGSTTFDGPRQVSISPSGCAGREGQAVTVTVSAPYRITIPFVYDDEVTLTGRAVFRCEA